MEKQQQADHEIERIMRRAEDAGHDPRRVARALGYRPAGTVELRRTATYAPRSWFGGRLVRRMKRRVPAQDG